MRLGSHESMGIMAAGAAAAAAVATVVPAIVALTSRKAYIDMYKIRKRSE